MLFHQSPNPALTIPADRFEDLVVTLLAAGYEEHDGRKIMEKNEVATFRKRYVSGGARRQCHVQVVSKDPRTFDVFAHTEPDMTSLLDVISHGISAITDQADYATGARMLLNDMKGRQVPSTKRQPAPRPKHADRRRP